MTLGPRVSVVLPTRNGAATLPALLDALWAQKTSAPIEIIAVDSGSTDGTLALLDRRVRTVVRIPSTAFDHGLSRNVGIERAEGDFVVLLVQDALPVSDDWINRLTAPLISDATLAGTYARQQPRPDASALTKAQLQRYAATEAERRISRLPGGQAEFDALSPVERLRRCTFDNVASCLRRSVWLRQPFKPTRIAEDVEWARDVLLAGFGIAFVPDAVVIHSHDRSAAYEYERTRVLHDRLYRLFGLQTIPTLPALARATLSSLALHLRCETQSPSRWPRAAALALAWPAGQYVGARQGRSADSLPRPKAGRI
jgi:rhamnosyltransferase